MVFSTKHWFKRRSKLILDLLLYLLMRFQDYNQLKVRLLELQKEVERVVFVVELLCKVALIIVINLQEELEVIVFH